MNIKDKEKANQYIAAYHLIEHHSQPGNLIADIYCGPEVEVDQNIFEGGKRPITNAIYYMVMGEAITQFNRLKSVKYWQYCDGSPQLVCIIDTEKNSFKEFILGDPILHADLATQFNKQVLEIIAILPTQWIASKLVNQNSFSLITCTVTPGFDMRDFTVMTVSEAISAFSNLSGQIKSFFNYNESASI